MEADLSCLPMDVLVSITERFLAIEDYVSFGGVCRSWRLALKSRSSFSWIEYSKSTKRCIMPWLMLAEKKDDDEYRNNRGFLSLYSDKVYEIELPELRERRCWGSPLGWLVTLGLDLNINLVNPLTRVQIALPPQWTFPLHHQYPMVLDPEDLRHVSIRKAVISSSPNSSDCVVVVIYSEFSRLGFARPGDRAWTPIECTECTEEVAFFNGNMFALTEKGHLFLCDLFCTPPSKSDYVVQPPLDDYAEVRYLVDLDGALHMISRFRDPANADYESYYCLTIDFVCYKLEVGTGKWIELSSLGSWCVFVGRNSSFALRASDYPQLRPNCIYFTDDYREGYDASGGCDIGIFDYEDESVYPFPVSQDLLSSICPPLWVVPQFR